MLEGIHTGRTKALPHLAHLSTVVNNQQFSIIGKRVITKFWKQMSAILQ